MANDADKDEQERKLFVGGLNKDLTDEEGTRNFFSQWGPIVDVTIMRDPSKVSRGFGFILFESYSAVDAIMRAKKNGDAFTLDGHTIEVKRALPKVAGAMPGGNAPEGMYRKIFVGGLASTTTEQDIMRCFEEFGIVSEVEILRERESGRPRGFAFVTFEDEDCANKCIQKRVHVINKKNCEVKRAQTRSNLNKEEEDRKFTSNSRDSGSRRDRDSGRDSGRDRPRSRDRDHRDSSRRSDDRHNGNSNNGNMMDMATVNKLIAEAHLAGMKEGLAQGAALSQQGLGGGYGGGLGGGLGGGGLPVGASPLLQALMQGGAGGGVVGGGAGLGAPGGVANLAALLGGQGVGEIGGAEPRDSRGGRAGTSSSSYSTSYPQPAGALDNQYQQQTSYGPAKDDYNRSKTREYRPY